MCAFGSLFLLNAASAQSSLPGVSSTRSLSGQFVVQSELAPAVSPRTADLETNRDFIPIDPKLLPVSGERLKRVPTGFAADHPGAELLKLKDVTFGRRLSDDDVLSPDLPDMLVDTFEAAVPLLRLLAALAPDAEAGWLRRG